MRVGNIVGLGVLFRGIQRGTDKYIVGQIVGVLEKSGPLRKDFARIDIEIHVLDHVAFELLSVGQTGCAKLFFIALALCHASPLTRLLQGRKKH